MLQERCQLYQMKDGEALREYIFQPFAVLASKRYFPNEADYDKAYDDLLRPNEDVWAVRERLSSLQRNRGCFRQINTSDVIVLRRETGTICCFVDGDGFVMLDGFFGLLASGNPLTLETEHYAIPGKKGLWRVVDSITYENVLFFLLEHEEHGREIPCVILDSKGEVVSDEITKDFDETAAEQMRLFLHPELPKQPVEHQRPPKELWQKFYENGEYVRYASHEVGSEENYNHIDGVNNNRKPQRATWVDPRKRPSVRKRLQEKLNQVHGVKEKQRTREKT